MMGDERIRTGASALFFGWPAEREWMLLGGAIRDGLVWIRLVLR